MDRLPIATQKSEEDSDLSFQEGYLVAPAVPGWTSSTVDGLLVVPDG